MNTIFWTLLTAVCSPFLFLAAQLRPRSAKRKILIIQWAKLGDMVCTTPMFRAIKEAHPDWTVHVLCRQSSAVALQGNPFIDRVIVGGTRGGMIQMLSRERYDAVINCLPGAFFSLVGLWCGARDRINTFSQRLGHLIRWTRVCNTVNLEYRPGDGTFRHYMKLVNALNVPAIPYQLDFFPSANDQRVIDEWMAVHVLTPGKFLCCNVSAGNAIKEWPMEHWVSLIDQITEKGMSVVLCTLDRQRVSDLRARSKNPDLVHDGSGFSLGQMGVLAKNASAYVAADTGPLYVAYAAGAKIVAIVGGSSPSEQLPPLGSMVVHVLPPAECVPWMFVTASPRQATKEQVWCVRGTMPETVLEEVWKLIR